MIDVPYLDEIRAATEFRFGIPAPVALVAAQIHAESNFNPKAVSKAGAKGLMQLMDQTAEFAARAVGPARASPFDAGWNIRAGVYYDRWNFERIYYNGKDASDRLCKRWGATLSSFNGGLGWHSKRRALADDPEDFWNSVRTINPGITAANQVENMSYSYRIVFVLQPKYAELGPLVCGGR